MLNKIIVILVIIAVLGAFFWLGYPVIKNRYFSDNGDVSIEISQEEIKETGETQESVDSNEDSEENLNDANVEVEDTESDTENDTADKADEAENIEGSYDYSVDVSVEDCENECEEYEDDDEDFKYCRETCGLAEDEESDSCEEKSGLEKDYCYKNRAVKESDFELCQKIKESGIREVCYNRITEEFIDESMEN